MVNYNGVLTDEANIALHSNRAFLYGDSIFETIKVLDGKVLFLEDHYFRLMASMRIVRMEIPMQFTMEYMEEQVNMLLSSLDNAPSYRVRLSVFRKPGGKYLPVTNDTEFIVTAEPLSAAMYAFTDGAYEVDLYKDFYVSKQLISTLKTTNKIVHVTGSIYADENNLQNCMLVNDDKNVIEALQGNVFMLMGNRLITPPISDGCLNGVMRKQILALAKKMDEIEVAEASISPFDLQKADEIFITNVIQGIQPITKYRKKEYGNALALKLLQRLNAAVRLG